MSSSARARVAERAGVELAPVEHLGVHLDPLELDELNALAAAAVAARERVVVANHNLHSIYLSRRDEAMRRFFARAAFTHIDGMPLVLTGRLAGLPLARRHRVTYADWIWPLMERARDGGWRVFHLGGRPGVAEAAFDRLRRRYPGLRIAGRHGYFDPAPGGEENRGVLAAIAAFHPDLLLVGMGMPRQERWILDNLEALEAAVILPSGACLDYVAGVVPTPPRWAGRVGLEWLFRLAAEPRRLARRYLLEPWTLLPSLVAEVAARRLGGRRRP